MLSLSPSGGVDLWLFKPRPSHTLDLKRRSCTFLIWNLALRKMRQLSDSHHYHGSGGVFYLPPVRHISSSVQDKRVIETIPPNTKAHHQLTMDCLIVIINAWKMKYDVKQQAPTLNSLFSSYAISYRCTFINIKPRQVFFPELHLPLTCSCTWRLMCLHMSMYMCMLLMPTLKILTILTHTMYCQVTQTRWLDK